MDKTNIANWIRSHEITESRAHVNPDGHMTIGIGFNLDEVGAREQIEGLGANFESVLDGTESLTEKQIEDLFNQNIDHSITIAHAIFPDLDSYPTDKQIVIIDMVYDLGERDFRKLDTVIDAIKHQDWTDASTKMQESFLFNQLSHRSSEEINLMRSEYTEPSPNLIDNRDYTGYTDTYYQTESVPHYVDSSLNSLDTAITTMHLMHLMDMQYEHPEHPTPIDNSSTTPSPDTSVDYTETHPVDDTPPYIDSSPHPTANDIYLMTDQPGDTGYPSFLDQTPTDSAQGTYVDYTETHPVDSAPTDTLPNYIDPAPQPITDDFYLTNDCLNVQGGWRTEDDLREFMGRNGFETSPPFNDNPGLGVYTDQDFPDSNSDGGHDFTSID